MIKFVIIRGSPDCVRGDKTEICAVRPLVECIDGSRGYPQSLLGKFHETHIPTFQNPSRTYPRFPGPHEDTRRPRCDQRTPRQGSQASGCLRRLRKPKLPAFGDCGSANRQTACHQAPSNARPVPSGSGWHHGFKNSALCYALLRCWCFCV